MLTRTQALQLLRRMQIAAPPTTAQKLREVAALIADSKLDGTPQFIIDEPPPLPSTGDLLSDSDVLILQLDEAIKPPLAVAKQMAAELITGMYGNLSSEQYDMAQVIEENIACGLSLMDSVQQILAIRRGLLEITPLIFSAALLLREAEREALAYSAAREHKLIVQEPSSDLEALGDYPRVRAIMRDLVDNAVRYTPMNGTVRLSAENLGTHVLFTVEDSGIGLSGDDLKHIGEPFWRAQHQPLVKRHSGTGLRLYLAREVLALQGGELIFSGEAGLGSTFSFTLPIAH